MTLNFQKRSTFETLLRAAEHRNGYPVFHWSTLHGNKFMADLHPMMLSEEGYYVFKAARIIGMKHSQDKIQCFIYYDNEYVVQKFGGLLLSLKSCGFNRIQQAIGESWQFVKRVEEEEMF